MGSSGRTPTPNRTDRFGLTTGDPGFRSITPNVLPTQHNRSLDRGLVRNISIVFFIKWRLFFFLISIYITVIRSLYI